MKGTSNRKKGRDKVSQALQAFLIISTTRKRGKPHSLKWRKDSIEKRSGHIHGSLARVLKREMILCQQKGPRKKKKKKYFRVKGQEPTFFYRRKKGKFSQASKKGI